MKLLLTSGGLMNQPIVKGLQQLLQQPFSQTNFLFVTTAANAESGDKDWLIKDLTLCQNLHPRQLDIIDFAGLTQEMWLPRFQEADVLIFGGGNTQHLMSKMRTEKLDIELSNLLQTRVYVGISAGSIVTTAELSLEASKIIYDEDYKSQLHVDALKYVPFQFFPHLNSKYFTKVTKDNIAKIASNTTATIYALDDQSAILVDGEKIEIISEGEWVKYN